MNDENNTFKNLTICCCHAHPPFANLTRPRFKNPGSSEGVSNWSVGQMRT